MALLLIIGFIILVVTTKTHACKDCKHCIMFSDNRNGACRLKVYTNREKWNPVTGRYERIRNDPKKYNCKTLNRGGLCPEFETKKKSK
jgi:hypothetical protein